MSDVSPVLIESPSGTEVFARISPANHSILEQAGLNPDECTMVELRPHEELFELCCGYIAQHSANVKSYKLSIGRAGVGCCGEEEGVGKRTVSPALGLGLHRFAVGDEFFHALHQTIGEPVGTECGAVLMTSLVLIAPAGRIETIRALCEKLVQEADKTHPSKFTVFRWHIQYSRWMRGQQTNARPIESVVLPKATQDSIISDLDDFLSAETRTFYESHGIPWKRSYLFFGSPGAGKTSVIQAIAGRYGRNVCYLSANPELSDDSLKAAIEHVPHKSIVVLEDVDALFDGKRQKADGKSVLTFSGLLNALDGVGGCSGQIFVLTTNHRERLDPALIRNGRVDLHVEFKDATTEQFEGLFKQFYPRAAEELATDFAKAAEAKLGERTVSMAALQSFFISMRKKSAEEAIGSVGKIVTELEERAAAKEKASKEKASNEKAEAEEEGATADAEGGEKKAGKKAKTPAAGEQPGETHVHIHMHK